MQFSGGKKKSFRHSLIFLIQVKKGQLIKVSEVLSYSKQIRELKVDRRHTPKKMKFLVCGAQTNFSIFRVKECFFA